MSEEKAQLDVLLEKFERSLPKHLQPHAFKIVFGAIAAGISAIIGYAYSLNALLGLLATVGILYGAVALWMFLKWFFTGSSD